MDRENVEKPEKRQGEFEFKVVGAVPTRISG